MKIDLTELRARDKYISEQKHPTLPRIIWNYTHLCQYDQAWDEYTIQARGLITDLEGNIIARPFKKFFNIGDEKNAPKMPGDNPIIYTKFDGSLGIQYYDGEKVCIATRGSFVSEQAKFATDLMSAHSREEFRDKYTYLYEIIYPENRIVVDYGDRRELVLLAVIDTETGKEMPYQHETWAKELDMPFAHHMIYTDLEKIVADAKNLGGNDEGYVFHWPQHDIRMKIKGDEYVRLHRILTGFSTKSIWEALANGDKLEVLLERVPDEFFDWVQEKKGELEETFQVKLHNAKLIVENMAKFVGPEATRKEKAEFILGQPDDLRPLAFAIMDGKDPSPMIWRQLKPKFEKPFKQDIDA